MSISLSVLNLRNFWRSPQTLMTNDQKDGIAERSSLAVDPAIDSEMGRLPREVEPEAFRIMQESLTNVYRHAHTKTARWHAIQTASTSRLRMTVKALRSSLLWKATTEVIQVDM